MPGMGGEDGGPPTEKTPSAFRLVGMTDALLLMEPAGRGRGWGHGAENSRLPLPSP